VMISIFPLWTFHLYVATFQQHLHMEYVYLSCNWVIFCHNKWVEINYCFIMTVS
jgi:hypothetical protein